MMNTKGIVLGILQVHVEALTAFAIYLTCNERNTNERLEEPSFTLIGEDK